MNLPYLAIYKGDFLRNNVSGLSIAAQGLWLRLMILMHDSERPGYLSLNGEPMPPRFAAAKCSVSLDEYSALLSELDMARAFERSKEGILFSPQIIEEAAARAQNAERQRRFKEARKGNGQVTAGVTEKKRGGNGVMSSSVSSSNKNPALRAVASSDPEGHKRLFSALQDRAGPISDGAAQGKAIKWLLAHYDETTCIECLDALREEDWRKGRVSWLTVQKEIGAWLARRAAPPKERKVVL